MSCSECGGACWLLCERCDLPVCDEHSRRTEYNFLLCLPCLQKTEPRYARA